MARVAYHHGHLREAVLAEATALVDAGEPLGLRELGRRIGVSHTAVHHHFPSVDALANALAAIWFADLDRAMGAAADAIPPSWAPHDDSSRAPRVIHAIAGDDSSRAVERFRALGVGYVRYALAHPHRYRLQFRGGLVPEADASFRRVLEAVVACRRAVDPLVMTTLAWSAMHGLAMLWIDGAFRNRLDRRGIDALTARIAALISELLTSSS